MLIFPYLRAMPGTLGRIRKPARLALLLTILVASVCSPVLAEDPPWTTYTVQPGDALPALAERYGVLLGDILHRNGLQTPRDLYPGQEILLPERWSIHIVQDGDSLLDIAQAAGVAWQDIALRNRMLLPQSMGAGFALQVPMDTPPFSVAARFAAVPRVEAALRYGVPWWQVVALNPLPIPGSAIVLPASAVTITALPDPRLLSLTVSPQPVARGETTRLTLSSSAPLTCTVVYLESTEPCYPEPTASSSRLYYSQYIGLPALLEPGTLTVTLRVEFDDAAFTLPYTVRVHAGSYDYERFDLVPGGQAAANPALAAHEAARIAELRLLRTPERIGTLPFSLPVDASVTSYYGSRRSYGYGFTSYHGGTDFRAQLGTPVYAPADGVVVLAEPLAVRGNAIIIDHGQGIVTGYWHLTAIDVVEGDRVYRGEAIGKIGSTGFSTGPHLHWELWVNGTAVSPLQWVYDVPFLESAQP